MIAIGIGNERQFSRCAEVLGHPEWAQDARYNSNRARVENRVDIDGKINEALAHDVADAWLGKLMAVGVPCGKINTVAQALDDPHTAARRMVETVEHPTIGELRMLGIPFKFSDTACSVRRPPPMLGQHTDEVLSQELGLDARGDRRTAAAEDRVIARAPPPCSAARAASSPRTPAACRGRPIWSRCSTPRSWASPTTRPRSTRASRRAIAEVVQQQADDRHRRRRRRRAQQVQLDGLCAGAALRASRRSTARCGSAPRRATRSSSPAPTRT